MAKIKYSMLVSDMRGKLNGSVLSRNTYGSYSRNKVTPVNPSTTYQQNVRSQFTTLTQGWRALTQVQRDSWISAVNNFIRTNIFGDSQKLTGSALYISINRNLQAIGQSVLTSPPIPGSVFNLTTLSIAADASDNSLDLTFTAAIPAGTSVIVEATPPVSAGINFVKSQYRQIAVLTNSDTSPYDASAEYQAKFGSVGSAGQKIFVRMRAVTNATGLTGTPLEASTIVVA